MNSSHHLLLLLNPLYINGAHFTILRVLLWFVPVKHFQMTPILKWLQGRFKIFWSDSRLHFYQTRSAWSMDQGSTRKHSPVHNFAPTVTKFCVRWEGLSLPHDTKFGNCRSEIVDRRVIITWSLIHGSSWSGLIKVGPESFENILNLLLDSPEAILKWLPLFWNDSTNYCQQNTRQYDVVSSY